MFLQRKHVKERALEWEANILHIGKQLSELKTQQPVYTEQENLRIDGELLQLTWLNKAHSDLLLLNLARTFLSSWMARQISHTGFQHEYFLCHNMENLSLSSTSQQECLVEPQDFR